MRYLILGLFLAIATACTVTHNNTISINFDKKLQEERK